MDSKTIPQKNDIRHKSIAKFLPYGAQTELAQKHSTSLAFVNAVVNGARTDNKIYADALLMAAAELNERKKREEMNQQAESLAEILLK